MEQQFADAVQQAVQEAHAAAGHEFNLGSPKQLQEVLFGELGLPKTKKTKTGYTTDADALAWLAAQTEHELPVIMLRHREQAKLRTTVEGLIKTIAADGRIHTTFNQTVAATGRLSSTDPNLQNIPVRTDEGRAIRRGFVVGEGYESLLTADYSQIELRVMAHLSEDEGLIEAFTSGEDLHTTVASQVFAVARDRRRPGDAPQDQGDVATAWPTACRRSASPSSWASSPDEARKLMDNFFERFGGVRDYLQRAVEEARATGYTETILGRRRYLPDLNSDNRQRREMAERMALNAPDPGHRRRHRQDRHAEGRRGPARGRADVPDAAPGPRRNRAGGRRRASGSRSRSWSAARWPPPSTCAPRWTSRSARARTGSRPRTDRVRRLTGRRTGRGPGRTPLRTTAGGERAARGAQGGGAQTSAAVRLRRAAARAAAPRHRPATRPYPEPTPSPPGPALRRHVTLRPGPLSGAPSAPVRARRRARSAVQPHGHRVDRQPQRKPRARAEEHGGDVVEPGRRAAVDRVCTYGAVTALPRRQRASRAVSSSF